MDKEILKHFIGQNVEVLVGGVWIEGHLQPISKGIIVLLPIGEASAFYGPTSMKEEAVQAIRQIRKAGPVEMPAQEVQAQTPVRSSLDEVTPAMRFKRKQ